MSSLASAEVAASNQNPTKKMEHSNNIDPKSSEVSGKQNGTDHALATSEETTSHQNSDLPAEVETTQE